jgi:hypothetical protein
MPTNSIEELLPRDLSPDIQEVLSRLSGLIEETVNFGTYVFDWCVNSGATGNEHAPLMLSFRHVLEMLDAISVLVRVSCFEPAKLILRSVFETSLNMQYLVQSDFKCRSHDFIYYHTLHQKKSLHSILENKKKQIQSITDTGLLKKISFTIKKIDNEIGIIDKQLDRSYLADSKNEYTAYKRNHKTSPSNWFSLRNGPQNIAELAEKLKKKESYLILYKKWSQLTHGTEIFQNKVQKASDGGTYFVQIRLPVDNDIIPSLAISYGLDTMRIMISKYVPAKIPNMNKWYETEIKKDYLALSEKKPILIDDSELP